jgi:hypothetical protein
MAVSSLDAVPRFVASCDESGAPGPSVGRSTNVSAHSQEWAGAVAPGPTCSVAASRVGSGNDLVETDRPDDSRRGEPPHCGSSTSTPSVVRPGWTLTIFARFHGSAFCLNASG